MFTVYVADDFGAVIATVPTFDDALAVIEREQRYDSSEIDWLDAREFGRAAVRRGYGIERNRGPYPPGHRA